MNAQLNQNFAWDAIPGASYQVKARRNGDGIVVVQDLDVGTANSVNLGTLLGGQDFTLETTFRVSVRSVLADGSLPSAYSPEISVTVVGYGIPANLRVE